MSLLTLPKRLVYAVVDLWRDLKGIAATEFAVLMPVLVVMFFGLLETAESMTVNRRVSIAVNTASDLAAQSINLTPNDIRAIFDGATEILEPKDITNLQFIMTSVVLDADDKPIVHWTLDNDFASSTEPYNPGDVFAGLSGDFEVNANGLIRLKNHSLIVVEMSYPYAPTFAGRYVSSLITFNRIAMRAPRQATRVQLCENDLTNCTT